jgi:hypothetical protein
MNTTMLETCIVLLLTWLVWTYGWRRFALDRHRQELFSIRDRLFDLALENYRGFSFDHPAYQAMRTSINGRLRFAHRFNSLHLVFALLSSFFHPNLRGQKCDLELKVEAVLDPYLRHQLEKFRIETIFSLLKYVAWTSPFLMITGVPFGCMLGGWLYTRLRSVATQATQRHDSWLLVVDAQADLEVAAVPA